MNAPVGMQRITDEGPWESRWIEEDIKHLWSKNLEFGGAGSFSWPDEIGTWASELIRALGVESYSACEAEGTKKHPGRKIHPEGFETYVFLSYDADKRKSRCEIRGADSQRDHRAEICRWKHAARTASDRMQNAPRRGWVALIGIDHHASRTYGEETRLTEQATIGGLTLIPAPEPHVERVFFPQGAQRMKYNVWPIAVLGSARCRPDGTPIADTDIKNLCHTLAVCTGQRWVVRYEPTTEFDRWEAGLSSLYSDSDVEQECLGLNPSFELPKEAVTFYEGLEEDESLSRAAGTYSEGLSLLSEHPSLALVCFIAVIETVAESGSVPLEQCPTCNGKTGAIKRFRSALEKVCKDQRLLNSLSNLYKNRSRTVHAGVFHGGDGVLFGTSWDLLSSEGTFSIQTMEMADASRDLLFLRARELKGDTGPVSEL